MEDAKPRPFGGAVARASPLGVSLSPLPRRAARIITQRILIFRRNVASHRGFTRKPAPCAPGLPAVSMKLRAARLPLPLRRSGPLRAGRPPIADRGGVPGPGRAVSMKPPGGLARGRAFGGAAVSSKPPYQARRRDRRTRLQHPAPSTSPPCRPKAASVPSAANLAPAVGEGRMEDAKPRPFGGAVAGTSPLGVFPVPAPRPPHPAPGTSTRHQAPFLCVGRRPLLCLQRQTLAPAVCGGRMEDAKPRPSAERKWARLADNSPGNPPTRVPDAQGGESAGWRCRETGGRGP